MASRSLYPPLVESYSPAFIAGGTCRIYFSLSKYSSTQASDIKSIHISIVKQTSGQSVVNKQDDFSSGRFRSTGIIILNDFEQDTSKENLYYVDIRNEDIKSGDKIGWKSGWIYKIQIRLSSIEYPAAGPAKGAYAWLNDNANSFSEWSTYCTTKAISTPVIKIPFLQNFDSLSGYSIDKEYSLSISTIDFNGSYENEDKSEVLYSYQVQLFDNENNLLENSDLIYSNQYFNSDEFHYLFKYELENEHNYIVKLTFTTINKYTGTYSFNIAINQIVSEDIVINAITLDNVDNLSDEDYIKDFKSLTSLPQEQEESRIGIKFYSTETSVFNGNICLRRSDSKDNFSTWSDIKIVNCTNTIINNLPMMFDYTAESGVWYRYGVQLISTEGDRSILRPMTSALIREFDYSYLLGENGRQLKLQFNNSMNSYNYTISESRNDTIGGKYPFITRNGNVKYRTFPVNGLISFKMDDNKLFTSDEDLYTYDDVISAYQNRRIAEGIDYYDYKLEHDFREKVLEFLQDGKPKLFKSATEGNIIVRLMDVTTQPNQTLNRMLYSFSANAFEIAEATMENYQKYNFYQVGEWSDSFKNYETKLGQISLELNNGDDIITKIWEKYDHSNENIAGYKITLDNIYDVVIHFEGDPIVTNSNGSKIMGNSFRYNNNTFIVNDTNRTYSFDEIIKFKKNNSIKIIKDFIGEYNDNSPVPVLVDFVYETITEPYVEKTILSKENKKGVGQIYGHYKAGTNLYNEVYYKYYYEWEKKFSRLSALTWTCLEAAPGAVFEIRDEFDPEDIPTYHEINETGVLNFEGLGIIKNIVYKGMRDLSTGMIDSTKDADIIVDYFYYVTKGEYK
jgi:hypothetical protein